jgi:hypothetical protein
MPVCKLIVAIEVFEVDQCPPEVPPEELKLNVDPRQTEFPPVIVPAFKAGVIVAVTKDLEDDMHPLSVAST